MRKIIVDNLNKNIYLSNYILNYFPNLAKGVLFKALRNKDIKLNKKRINKDIIINKNDEIEIYISDNLLFALPDKVNYIYEDENIAIVFKPQGILSNDEYNKSHEPTLDDLVKKENPNYLICHRLDRNTAGLVIFAKTNAAYKQILSGFKNGNITKEYLAYVANAKFNKYENTLNQYISTNKNTGISSIYDKYKVKNNIKSITTSYKVIYTSIKKDFAILKVFIHSGKTHQIRAVLSNISHPIIGDSKYGKNEINKKFKKYKQLLFARKYTFNFEENSILSYLNKKQIILDESYYLNYIGDLYEKFRES